jgi:hypothetical protein
MKYIRVAGKWRRTLGLSLALLGCALPPKLYAMPDGDIARALGQVNVYSKAYLARDLSTLVALSHPVFGIRMGGTEKYRQFLERIFAQFKDIDFEHGTDVIGTPSEEFVLDSARMLGFPAVRKAAGSADTPHVYVAVSYDNGANWSIVDIACIDQRWLEALVPGYHGVPDILGIADASVAETIKIFDEQAFLRGPTQNQRSPLEGAVGAHGTP